MASRKISVSKKKISIVLIIVLLIAGGVGYWAWHNSNKPKPLGIGEVNYDGPTKNDKKEAEDHKKELENSQNNQSSSNQSSNQNATAVITYLSTTEARGYVNGVLEDDGTCTMTLTKGPSKVTASSAGISDVNKTTCGPMSIDQNQLTPGSWTAVLSYSSSKSNGSSAPQKLSVP